jgi:small subunit ribosomal protein S1
MADIANITTMDELVQNEDIALVPFKAGQVVEAEVISAARNKILVDLAGLTVGMVPGREFSAEAAEIKPGDKVLAYIITLENEDGMAVLSMRRADRERIWRTIKDKQESGEVVTVKVMDVNKGGLLVDFSGAEGFIPASQLSAAHYPKVADGERDQIMNQLRELVGNSLSVKILSFDQQSNKLIFSEKAAGDTEVAEKAKTLPIGDRMTGEVTGVVEFGIFVRIADNIEGLVHISEVSWDKIDNLKDRFKPGDKVEVVVIGVEGSRVSLSMKRLQDDPWQKKVDTLKVGQVAEGEVTRVTPFGAFVRLLDGVDGLVHISELGQDKLTDPHDVVTVGQSYSFEILSIEPMAHRISLRLKK